MGEPAPLTSSSSPPSDSRTLFKLSPFDSLATSAGNSVGEEEAPKSSEDISGGWDEIRLQGFARSMPTGGVARCQWAWSAVVVGH